jgi:predicted unusual protein kinase regulating ubiquinone biosynthesis (AarF/ABC1/UbiB family)
MQTLKGKFENLEHLMGRVVALLYAIIYSGITALAAGSTFAKGTVGTFLNTFCFPAGTAVLCEDGTYKPIETLVVGDRLASYAGRNIVESTFVFDGSQTDMVTIEGVIHHLDPQLDLMALARPYIAQSIKKELNPISLYPVATAIAPSAFKASASSLMICQWS